MYDHVSELAQQLGTQTAQPCTSGPSGDFGDSVRENLPNFCGAEPAVFAPQCGAEPQPIAEVVRKDIRACRTCWSENTRPDCQGWNRFAARSITSRTRNRSSRTSHNATIGRSSYSPALG